MYGYFQHKFFFNVNILTFLMGYNPLDIIITASLFTVSKRNHSIIYCKSIQFNLYHFSRTQVTHCVVALVIFSAEQLLHIFFIQIPRVASLEMVCVFLNFLCIQNSSLYPTFCPFGFRRDKIHLKATKI